MDRSQLLRGALDAAVLAVVAEADGYGYDVLRRLRDAVDRAQVAVTIPTTEHASLNVAQAVLVALGELLAAQAGIAINRKLASNPGKIVAGGPDRGRRETLTGAGRSRSDGRTGGPRPSLDAHEGSQPPT